MTDLGIYLKIPVETIKSIRTDNQTSINQAAFYMLYQWLKYFRGTALEAISVLKEALVGVGLASLTGNM